MFILEALQKNNSRVLNKTCTVSCATDEKSNFPRTRAKCTRWVRDVPACMLAGLASQGRGRGWGWGWGWSWSWSSSGTGMGLLGRTFGFDWSDFEWLT